MPLYIAAGHLVFGGLPDNFKPPRDALSNQAYFVGCISDVTANGEIINFADSVEKKNGNINACPADILGKLGGSFCYGLLYTLKYSNTLSTFIHFSLRHQCHIHPWK